ncbi:hypothetical protein SAMN04244548_00503 [Paracoccus pantotrophus]|nr:hypothetical protein SAMN04244548_00503 [Paracoccus pantotrophus]
MKTWMNRIAIALMAAAAAAMIAADGFAAERAPQPGQDGARATVPVQEAQP